MKSLTEFRRGVRASLAEKISSRLKDMKIDIAGRIFSEDVEGLDEAGSKSDIIIGSMVGATLGSPAGIPGMIAGALAGASWQAGGKDGWEYIYNEINKVSHKDFAMCQKIKSESKKKACIAKVYEKGFTKKLKEFESKRDSATNDAKKKYYEIRILGLKRAINKLKYY